MNYRLITPIVLVMLLAGAIGVSGYLSRSAEKENPEMSEVTSYECNSDGFICPDGSVVGRAGPKCEFSACPGISPATSTQTTATGILYGKVTLSPVCPVESDPPRPGCAPKPYVTEMKAYTMKGKEYASTKTTAEGTFIMDLFPGNYVIRAAGAALYPRCEEKQITVHANASTTVSISCDTGIR